MASHRTSQWHRVTSQYHRDIIKIFVRGTFVPRKVLSARISENKYLNLSPVELNSPSGPITITGLHRITPIGVTIALHCIALHGMAWHLWRISPSVPSICSLSFPSLSLSVVCASHCCILFFSFFPSFFFVVFSLG